MTNEELIAFIGLGKSINRGADNDYIRGMYNAFELLQSCIEQREPQFLDPFLEKVEK